MIRGIAVRLMSGLAVLGATVCCGPTGCGSLRPPLQLSDAEMASPPTLSVGDPAPPLHIAEWVRGPEVRRMERGTVYLIDFWATWCGPCIASMGRTSRLQDRHPDQLVVIALTSEDRGNGRAPILQYAQTHPGRTRIAIDRGSATTDSYRRASREGGIPSAFVVDQQGRLAWIGHPADAAPVVEALLDNKWDIESAARTRRDFVRRRMDAAKYSAEDRAAQRAGDTAARLGALERLCGCGVEAIPWSPRYAPWTIRIQLCHELGRRDDALRAATEALDRFPEDGGAHAWVASALIPIDLERAGAAADRAERLLKAQEAGLGAGDDWDQWMAGGVRESMALSYQNVASVRFRQGEPARAAELQRKAISLVDAEAYPEYVGDMRKALGAYEGAIR